MSDRYIRYYDSNSGSTTTGTFNFDKSKKYKLNKTSGSIEEVTALTPLAADEISIPGSKSSLRRIGDLERNITILASKAGISGATNSDTDTVLKTSAQALSTASNALTSSNATITLARGDGTTDVVTVNNVANASAATTATKWATARTLTLAGDASGSVSIDGSANVSLTVAVANDSHTHAFVNLTSKPTTLAGYGITDAYTSTNVDASIATAISNLVNSAPGTLDTLNELAAALGDDPNFATTVTNSIATKLNTSSYTAADVLTKIKTVDGAASGLDADLLDGNHASAFALASHTHDDRYYTESEADSRFVNASGGTMSSDLTVSKAAAKVRLYDSAGTTGNNPAIEWDTPANQGISLSLNVYDGELPQAGYGMVFGPSTTNTQWPATGNLSVSVLGELYAGSESLSSVNRVFHDGYHPNADTLTTARNIALAGDVTGSANFDGSGNISITATVADDSHNHIISNVDGLQAALDGKAPTSHTHDYVPERSRSDWNDSTVINDVIGQMAWKHHGNNHTIFDASNSTSPTGVAKNNTNPDVPWAATYPTLMGYNGTNTYGVRVDIARKAELLGGLAATQFLRSDVASTSTSTVNAATFNATSTAGGGFQGIDADTATAPSFTWTADLNTGIYRPAADQLGITTGGAARGVFSATGLSVTGSITATGDVTAYSDERLKDNIEVIPNAGEKVAALRGVTFTRKADGIASTGLVAQDVAAVLPEAVIEGDDGMLSVKYGNIVGLLVEAIKELQAEVAELKKK